MRACKRCKVVRPLDDFYKNAEYLDGHLLLCKICSREDQKAWRQAHPGSSRRNWLRMQYGMTEDDYGRMFSAQSGKCAICGSSDVKLYVDHDHQDGNVRGLLCDSCNKRIGYLRDNIEILASAIGYLEKSKRISEVEMLSGHDEN